MEYLLNQKAQALHQGAIREMFERAASMEGTVNLGIGEPDITTPAEIIQAACRAALDEGHTHYTPNAGFLSLRRAIAQSQSIAAAGYDPETEIAITNGGMGALSGLLLVLLEQGDEVLVPDPIWLNYHSQIKFAGGAPVSVPTTIGDGFALQPEEILKRVTSKTKAIIINNPANPTGALLDEQAVSEIARIARERDLLVISDEVYNTLVYDGKKAVSIATLPGMKERTVTVNSFSKAFAMTGWRVGYAAGPAPIIKKMTQLQEIMIACASSVSQKAAEFALSRDDISAEICALCESKRDFAYKSLTEIPGLNCIKPEGAFYIFPDISAFGMDSKSFCERLLDTAGAVCIPGSAFGASGEGFVRISYANSMEKLSDGMSRIKNFIEKL